MPAATTHSMVDKTSRCHGLMLACYIQRQRRWVRVGTACSACSVMRRD